MIGIIIFDENNVYIKTTQADEEDLKNIENYTTVPLLVGYTKPTFNEDKQEWCEGATDEEKQKWEEENQQVDKTKISPTNDELKEENERLWETVEFLLKQVNMIPKEVVANE